jgi:hypothetical protein
MAVRKIAKAFVPGSPPASTAPASAVPAASLPAAMSGAGPAHPLLFGRDGRILLPPAHGGRRPLREDGVADLRHFQQAPCRGTRYARDYARGQDENLGDEIARKYLAWIGLYSRLDEQTYRARRDWHDQACKP